MSKAFRYSSVIVVTLLLPPPIAVRHLAVGALGLVQELPVARLVEQPVELVVRPDVPLPRQEPEEVRRKGLAVATLCAACFRRNHPANAAQAREQKEQVGSS